MPGQTENFGIRYPCPGDTITSNVFCDWANDIDEAVSQVGAASQASLNRVRSMLRTDTTGDAIPVGGLNPIQFSTLVYNNDPITAAGPFPGLGWAGVGAGPTELNLYMAQVTPLNTATTVTSLSVNILVGTTIVARRVLADSAVPTIGKPINLMGLGIRDSTNGGAVQVLWTGSGGPLFFYCQFSFASVAPGP